MATYTNRRYTDTSFLSRGMRGFLYVIHEIETRLNITIPACNVNSAGLFDFVLVSLTSIYDALNFIAETKYNKAWLNRKFKVIVGGAGCVNVRSLIDVVDYCFFGRAEDLIGEIAAAGFDYTHESFRHITDIEGAVMRQPQHLLLNVPVKQGGSNTFIYNESSIGCAQKCFYCHYTFSRKLINTKTYLHEHVSEGGHFVEMEQMDFSYFNAKIPMYVMAIDGATQELRHIYNRKQQDESIIDFFQRAAAETQCKGLIFKIFVITNLEYEREREIDQLIQMLAGIKNLRVPITVKLKLTPFRPSPLTPSEFSSVDLWNFRNHYPSGNEIKKYYYEYYKKENMFILQMGQNEDFKRYFMDMLIVRMTPETYPILDTIFTNKWKSLTNDLCQRFVFENYNLSSITREYGINETTPTSFLTSYVSRDKIKAMRTLMIKRATKAGRTP